MPRQYDGMAEVPLTKVQFAKTQIAGSFGLSHRDSDFGFFMHRIAFLVVPLRFVPLGLIPEPWNTALDWDIWDPKP